ncbi:MAG: EAL domain-containing response regulator [Telluria sp.]
MNCRGNGCALRVLLVDDDASMGALLAAALLHCGASEVMQAGDGAAALAALALPGAYFDMLVTDLRIGGMDGIELLERAAHHRVGAIAFASALDQQVLDAAAAVARAKGHRLIGTIHKPVSAGAVAELLCAYRRMADPAPPPPARAPQRPWRVSELRCALDQDQFVPYFQPKVELASGRPSGVEVLARWRHPRLGLIGPEHFIGVMEDGGLIGLLIDAMLRQTLTCMAAWDAAGAPLNAALNVAPQTLLEQELPNRLAAMVRAAGIAPERITIEVTETGLEVGAQAMLEGVTRLRMFGFKVSVDDFGTGQSTLLQLSKIPFTELKIDRFFVSAQRHCDKARAILESVLLMADKLGLDAVAEGIETNAERDVLRALGCKTGQGYLYAKPMPQHELQRWLAASLVPPLAPDQ